MPKTSKGRGYPRPMRTTTSAEMGGARPGRCTSSPIRPPQQLPPWSMVGGARSAGLPAWCKARLGCDAATCSALARRTRGWCLGCELGELVLRERRPGGGGGSSVGRMHGRAASGLGPGAQWLGFRGRQLERWALLEGKWYDFAALVDQRRCRSSATSRSLDAPSAGRAEAVPAATLIRQQPRARSGINERASDQKGTSVSPFLLHCCASAFFNEHCVVCASREAELGDALDGVYHSSLREHCPAASGWKPPTLLLQAGICLSSAPFLLSQSDHICRTGLPPSRPRLWCAALPYGRTKARWQQDLPT